MTAALRRAGPSDAEAVEAALAALARDLGDENAIGPDDLAGLGTGLAPSLEGVLAEADGALVGLALATPVFSTTRGGFGVYVSDLWVAPAARSAGLGARLLGAMADLADERWNARFLKLAVYDASTDARRFYDRLGFQAKTDEDSFFLEGAAYAALRDQA